MATEGGRRLGREFTRTDAKVRVVVPIRMREALGASVTMTTGFTNEIQVYPDELFESMVDERLTNAANALDYDQVEQQFVIPAQDGLNFDTSGRLMIQEEFRVESKVDKNTDVVVLWSPRGYMQIWNRAEYEEMRSNPSGYKRSHRTVLAQMPNPMTGQAPPAETDQIV